MAWEFSNDLPIYLQIAEHIKQLIAAGELKPGDKIPPVREFALEAGVNPNTMQKALAELERDNILCSKRTSGRFVSEDIEDVGGMKDDLAKLQIVGFIDNMKKIGFSNEDIINSISKYLKED